jgi:hypothetical protein
MAEWSTSVCHSMRGSSYATSIAPHEHVIRTRSPSTSPPRVTTPLVRQAEGVEVVQKGRGLPILRVTVKLHERVPLLRFLRPHVAPSLSLLAS